LYYVIHYLCVTKVKNMKTYIAISTEKGNTNGKIIGNTKQGVCKGMTYDKFYSYMKNNTWESFKIEEIS
jgi:hypothetical protein